MISKENIMKFIVLFLFGFLTACASTGEKRKCYVTTGNGHCICGYKLIGEIEVHKNVKHDICCEEIPVKESRR